MATNNPAVFFRGTPARGATSTTRAITTAALTSNLVTITTGTVHGITQVGTIVTIAGVSSVYDGVYAINSVPTTSTFTYVKTNANIGSASVTPNATAVFNTGVTNGGALSNQAIVNYTAIITTSAAHGLAVGDIVAVNTGSTGTDTAVTVVTSTPSATLFTFDTSTQTLASAAISQGAFGGYPVVYTAAAGTEGIVTNVVLTNPRGNGSGQYYVTVDQVPVVAGLTVPPNGTTVIDMKSYFASTKTIEVGCTIGTGTITVSGMTVVA
jgi:hypothetical protein